MCGQNKRCEDFGPWELIINNRWFPNFYKPISQLIDRETKQQIIQLELNIKSNHPKY